MATRLKRKAEQRYVISKPKAKNAIQSFAFYANANGNYLFATQFLSSTNTYHLETFKLSGTIYTLINSVDTGIALHGDDIAIEGNNIWLSGLVEKKGYQVPVIIRKTFNIVNDVVSFSNEIVLKNIVHGIFSTTTTSYQNLKSAKVAITGNKLCIRMVYGAEKEVYYRIYDLSKFNVAIGNDTTIKLNDKKFEQCKMATVRFDYCPGNQYQGFDINENAIYISGGNGKADNEIPAVYKLKYNVYAAGSTKSSVLQTYNLSSANLVYNIQVYRKYEDMTSADNIVEPEGFQCVISPIGAVPVENYLILSGRSDWEKDGSQCIYAIVKV